MVEDTNSGLVLWRDDKVAGPCAARLRQRLGMLPTESALSLSEVVAHQPMLDACRMPDQRVVLSAEVGVQSARQSDGTLAWQFFQPAADLPRGMLASLCGRSAHDLRAVLTALTGWVDLAQLDGRDDLAWVESLLLKMQYISDRLATAGQLQAGGMRLDISLVTHHVIGQRLHERLSQSLAPVQIEVAEGDYQVDVAIVSWAANVLVAAARQRDRHGKIKAEVHASDQGDVVLEVSDLGTGIDESEAAAINSGATWQLATNLQRSAGVGLSLLHAALNNVGGSLRVVGTVDPTCVRVTLPPSATAPAPA